MTDSIYQPGPPSIFRNVTFLIRSPRTGNQGFLDQIRQAVWSVNASLPVTSLQTMQEIYDHSLARTSFTLVMLAIAGAIALLLGIIGIYGVMAYTVAQRRREVGIRLALGARPSLVKWMFVRYALILAAVGAALGLAAAGGLSRVISSLLFGVSPLDPVTFAATPAILLLTAVAASYWPARRAARVDPAETLRAE
jgi:ABC-type antimicrobial peptide transport system permease subunit